MEILRDDKRTKGKRSPLESAEQAALFRWLRRNCVAAFCVPNGGLRPGRGGINMKAQGVTPGIPDLLIVDRPPNQPHYVGIALELKRANGKPSDIRPEQMLWLERFEQRGWISVVSFGSRAAIDWLRTMGYGEQQP